MFCKFCGQNIPDASEFCPECGKQLIMETAQERERGSVGVPFVLLMLLLCWDSVSAWGGMFVSGYAFGLDAFLTLLALLAGLAIVGVSVARGKIDPSVYRLSDGLVLACACIVVPQLAAVVERYFLVQFFGQSGIVAAVYASRVKRALQLTDLWLAVGITWLGKVRTAPNQPGKKWGRLLTFAPLLCIPLCIFLTRPLLMTMQAPAMEIATAIQIVHPWSLFCWLWPLVILKVFRALGEGRIGPVGAVAAFLGALAGEVLLLPVLIYWLSLRMTGYILAHGLSPLFGMLALCAAARLHKKKQVQEVN